MRSHIIDELRPTDPEIDPVWETETMRSILGSGGREAATIERPTWQSRIGRLTLVAATIAVIVGGLVVARQHLPADDIRPAKPVTKEKTQTIDPSKATVLKLDVVADLPQEWNGDPVYFSAFAGDRVVVGDVTQGQGQTANSGDAPLAQEHPVMYDLDTKIFTQLDDRARPEPTQIVDASGNDTTVVWAELVGTNVDASTFSIYSYDRETKKVATIGDFDDPKGGIVYGRDLALVGDTAYVSTPTYPAKAGQEAVYAMPVDGSSSPKVLAAGGQMLTISGDMLTYQVRDPKDRDAYPTFFTYDLGTGRTNPLPVSEHVDDPGFCGAEFTDQWQTWCAQRTDQGSRFAESNLLTIEETKGRTTAFKRFPDDTAPHNIMSLGPWTAITLTTSSGQDREYLVDLDTQDITVFPDNTSFDSLSPDRSAALISSYAEKGPGPQRIVRIPEAD